MQGNAIHLLAILACYHGGRKSAQEIGVKSDRQMSVNKQCEKGNGSK